MSETLERILYVEDDEDIAEVARIVFEDLGGFSVCHCSSGFAALEQVSAFKPQLVLLDMMMPGMDGVETHRRMKNAGVLDDVPVVFMTARAQHHEQEAYVALGALGVIVKPFDPMSLCDELRALWCAR